MSPAQYLISVVIPAHQAEAVLHDAIETALAQTYDPLEIIIVDDGSTDSTLSIARSHEPYVNVLTQSHSGNSSARNAALRVAHGSYFAFLDPDDLWAPNKLELQKAALDEDPFLDMVFTNMVQRNAVRSWDGQLALSEPVRDPQPACLPSGLLVRRKAFEDVGDFDPSVRVAEFLDWYLRAKRMGMRDAFLDEVLLTRRVHARQPRQADLGLQAYLRMVTAAAHQQRS